jgi:hypothetical protein
MKKIIVCCDGTWDRPDQTTDGVPCPSNVTKLYKALAAEDSGGVEQLRFYIEGVGTGRWNRLLGGAFGAGLSKNVREAYRHIAENYEPGDEIILIGFSRGAFTARSTAGFIRNCGLLRPEYLDKVGEAYNFYRDRDPATEPNSPAAKSFRTEYAIDEDPRIRCVAVWDTVGALGIPLNGLRWVNFFNRRWRFHDTALSSRVDFAFQALAIDEKRNSFEPSLWHQQADAVGQTLEQVWFSGSHGDVGGGNLDASLADVPLMWIVERLESACGVAFLPDGFSRPPADYLTRPNPLAQLTESWTGPWRILRPYARPLLTTDSEWIASTARRRYKRDDNYSPANLIPHLDNKQRIVRIELDRKAATTTTAKAAIRQPLIDFRMANGRFLRSALRGEQGRAEVQLGRRPWAAPSSHPLPGHRRDPDWHQNPRAQRPQNGQPAPEEG